VRNFFGGLIKVYHAIKKCEGDYLYEIEMQRHKDRQNSGTIFTLYHMIEAIVLGISLNFLFGFLYLLMCIIVLFFGFGPLFRKSFKQFHVGGFFLYPFILTIWVLLIATVMAFVLCGVSFFGVGFLAGRYIFLYGTHVGVVHFWNWSWDIFNNILQRLYDWQ